jgi:hypothetical protein
MKTVKCKRFDFIFILVIAFISSLFPFMASYSKLIGEPFDTRFQIVVHEHWFWWIKGERSLRDVNIFFPFDTTLGFSDIFLVNGFIYSILRFFNLSILNAWTLSNIVIIFIGNIGFFLFLTQILKNRLLIILGLITFSNSYAFIAFLDIWPNTVGYVLVSWILFFLYKIYNSHERNFVFWLNALLVSLPLLSLSFWYPGFFSILGTILFLLFILLGQKSVLVTWLKALAKKDNLVKLGFFAPIWLALWGIFLFITLPTRGNLRRAPEEIYKGSLEIADFFSIDLVGPTLLQDILKNFIDVEWSSANQFWAVGYPLLTILAFLWISLKSRVRIFKFNNLYSFTYFTVLFSVLLTMRMDEFGLYILLWQNFDLLGIIRTPVRINILINFLILILIFKYIDEKIIISNNKQKFLYVMLISIISLDQLRIPTGTWTKDNFINKDLYAQASEIKNNCAFFVLVNEGAGHWSDTIESMVLSSLINVPTINGYSGTFPEDSIKLDWDQPSANKFAVDYINRNNLDQTGCIVSNSNYSRLAVLNPRLIVDLIGSSTWESTKNTYWLWFTDNQVSLRIFNPFDNHIIPASELRFRKSPCLDEVILNITQESNSTELYLNKKDPESLFTLDEIAPNSSIYLEIDSTEIGCFVGEDPRPLIYALEITK